MLINILSMGVVAIAASILLRCYGGQDKIDGHDKIMWSVLTILCGAISYLIVTQ